MVSMPQTAVSSGSQIFGDIFFNTRFDGNSLSLLSDTRIARVGVVYAPRNVRRIKNTQPNRILMVIDVDILLETQDLRIAHIRAIDERTQKEECEDG